MRRARGERGQILAVVALALVALLGIAAFSIDVGFAYYGKRQLQSATDAAALAGAQDLPSSTQAISTASDYATANTPPNLTFAFTYQTTCTATSIIATGCSASVNPNELTVSGTGSTNTWFAKIFGITHFDLSAHANACSPCSSTPVDIVIAVDRTGSMCSPTGPGGSCTDLNNAKAGIRTMLGILNPPYAQVGMVAFPPLEDTSTDVCNDPYNSVSRGYDGYDSPDRGYVSDTINGDYKDGALLDSDSGLYKHTVSGKSSACIRAGGNTSYSEALRQAQAELLAHGRAKVPNYIVFLTDGEANIGSVYPMTPGKKKKDPPVPDPTYPQNNLDDKQPCHTAINVANAYKAAGTTIYSIGYALGSDVKCTRGDFGVWVDATDDVWNAKHTKIITPGVDAHYDACTQGADDCVHYASDTHEDPEINSYNTLSQIASPGDFYNQPDAAQLNTIFSSIATDIASGSSRLVDDGF
jgi:Flp pilus assembly protein TadG